MKVGIAGTPGQRSGIALCSEYQYTAPCPVSLSDDKLFFGPKHNMYPFFMILFDLFDLILLFCLSNLSYYLCNRKLKINEIYLQKYYFIDKHNLLLHTFKRLIKFLQSGGKYGGYLHSNPQKLPILRFNKILRHIQGGLVQGCCKLLHLGKQKETQMVNKK